MLNVILAFMHIYIFHAYCVYHIDVTNLENYIITSSSHVCYSKRSMLHVQGSSHMKAKDNSLLDY